MNVNSIIIYANAGYSQHLSKSLESLAEDGLRPTVDAKY